MRIAFILDDEALRHEPLGVMVLSAALMEHGHRTEFFALGAPAAYPQTVERVKAFAPRMIAYSCVTGSQGAYAAFNRLCRAAVPGVFSIMGGPHPTFFPQFLEENRADFEAICAGEGEFALAELAGALEEGRDYRDIRNLHVAMPDGSIKRNPTRPFVRDLDSLPFADRTLMERFPHLKDSGIAYVMAGRGCPYDCAFCFNHAAKGMAEGPYVRWRSPGRVIEELRELRDKRGRRFISFQDDTFTLDKEWFLEFAALYGRKIGLPYQAHVRANRIDESIAAALARSGCVRACVGLESGSEYLRTAVLAKKITDEECYRAARLITGHGMDLMTQNIAGVPGETPATVLDTIKMNIRCKTKIVLLNFFQPYPGTRLGEIAREQGLWDGQLDQIPVSYRFHMSLTLKHRAIMEEWARLIFLFCDYPWLFRVCEPILRAAARAGWPQACAPLTNVLTWWDNRTALRPPRGFGTRYHDPKSLS